MIDKLIDAVKKTDIVTLVTLLVALAVGYALLQDYHDEDVTSVKLKQIDSEISNLSTDEYWIEKEATREPDNDRAQLQLRSIRKELTDKQAEKKRLVEQ